MFEVPPGSVSADRAAWCALTDHPCHLELRFRGFCRNSERPNNLRLSPGVWACVFFSQRSAPSNDGVNIAQFVEASFSSFDFSGDNPSLLHCSGEWQQPFSVKPISHSDVTSARSLRLLSLIGRTGEPTPAGLKEIWPTSSNLILYFCFRSRVCLAALTIIFPENSGYNRGGWSPLVKIDGFGVGSRFLNGDFCNIQSNETPFFGVES